MKAIAEPILGGMITSTVHVLILVPVFFVMMKERALKRGTLLPRDENSMPPAMMRLCKPHSKERTQWKS
jgi:Cu(I)/Ag(I) efflux system membrane protein CusA/SilA